MARRALFEKGSRSRRLCAAVPFAALVLIILVGMQVVFLGSTIGGPKSDGDEDSARFRGRRFAMPGRSRDTPADEPEETRKIWAEPPEETQKREANRAKLALDNPGVDLTPKNAPATGGDTAALMAEINHKTDKVTQFWPGLASNEPWPAEDPSSCDGYFGNGFNSPFSIIPPNLGGKFQCFYHPALTTHYCDIGECSVFAALWRCSLGDARLAVTAQRMLP